MFQSKNINEGWNGYFKGIKQELGAYVWQCSFQLIGESFQKKSGSLILVR